MRIQLESPRNSGHTNFAQATDEDVLMEDELVAASPREDDAGMEMEEDEDGSEKDQGFLSPGQRLSDFGIANSEQLIKRLKSKEDVDAKGKSKIDIAGAAFVDDQMPVPKKIFLLVDWLLDTIVKSAKELPSCKLIDLEMDENVWAELFVDDKYWHLLHFCIERLETAEVALLANRYSLSLLLLSYLYHWRKHYNLEIEIGQPRQDEIATMLSFFQSLKIGRTSRQAYPLESLNQCLASWLRHAALFDGSMIYRHEEGEAPYPAYLTLNVEFLEMALELWLVEASKPSNKRKTHNFFLAELLPLQSQALWCLYDLLQIEMHPEWKELLDRSRAITYRISYQSVILAKVPEDTQQAILKVITPEASAKLFIFLPTYLSQLCLHERDTQRKKGDRSWVKDGEWRENILLSYVAPAIDVLLSSTATFSLDDWWPRRRTSESLLMLLSSSKRWHLHFSDELLSWRRSLERVTDYALDQLSRVIPSDTTAPPGVDKSITYGICMGLLSSVHGLDESVLEGDRLTRSIQCALHHSRRKVTLLEDLCSASIRSRNVVAFVNSCQDALTRAAIEKATSSESLFLESLLGSRLFQEEFWHTSIGIAVRDFLSVRDMVQLLKSFLARLEKDCSAVHTLAVARSGFERGDADQDTTDRTFTIAVLQTYFACAIVRHLNVQTPAYAEVQDTLSLLQANVLGKHLEWTLPRVDDADSDALAAALLKLHDSIQQLALTCQKEEQVQSESTWDRLATNWDTELGRHHSTLSSLMTSQAKRSIGLKAQILLSVLGLIGRALERRLTTPFDALLRGSEDIALFMPDAFKNLCRPIKGNEALDGRALLFPHRLWSLQMPFDAVHAWDSLVSSNLPIFERLASDKLLATLASLLIALIKPNIPYGQAWKLLLSNSRNLELPRWRAAIGVEMKKAFEVTQDRDKPIDVLFDDLRTLSIFPSCFPSEWLPADLPRELSKTKEFFERKDPTSVRRVKDDVDKITTTSLHPSLIAFCIQSQAVDRHVLVDFVRKATQAEYAEELDSFTKALVRFGTPHKQALNPADGKNEAGDVDDLLLRCKSLRAVLQTIAILLCNSPEGTLLVSQRCLTAVINKISTKVNDEDRNNQAQQSKAESDVKELHRTSLASIQFIETVLSAKPILFRSGDISAILKLSTDILVAQCSLEARYPDKRRRFFTCICTTLIECIRLRRDYVSQYLPQLTMLLARMTQVFQATAKVKRDGEPVQTVGLGEAKLFSRLLSTVTSKSTSTSIGGLPESKLKSLAKSFSTHAPYVVVALVRNMTSPTFARGEIREELIRGIYELCDIVGPWQKNVMMDMLADEGERIVMRSLWRGWEAQRYKGA